MFNVSDINRITLLNKNGTRHQIVPKKDLKLTNLLDGLSVIDKAGISVVVSNIIFDKTSQLIRKTKISKEQSEEFELTIDNILKNI
jgi:hypothetical protein